MKIIITVLILQFFIFTSCDRKENHKIIHKKNENVKLTESISDGIEYTLSLPDTVKLNESYDVRFNFNSEFDKIVDPMVDTVNFRTITFYYYNPVHVGKINDKGLVLKDSILIPNKEFILGNVKFNEKGSFLFLAMIVDQIMYNNLGIRDSIHIERKIQEIKKEITVIE